MRWLLDAERRPRLGWRLLAYLLVFAVSGAAAGIGGHALRELAPRWMVGLAAALLGGIPCLLGFRVLRSRMDRRPWEWLGLTGSGQMASALGRGFAVGVLMLLVLFCLEWRLGWIEPSWVHAPGRPSALVGALLAALGIGLLEELLLRGAFLQNLGERLPLWAATGCTGVTFGLLHLANPAQRVDAAFVVSAVLATLMLVLARFVTGTLTWAIGWHAGWDWMQDALGVASPGAARDFQLVSIVQHGPVGWMGQAPSIEGGGLAILLIGLATTALWLVGRRRGQRIDWSAPLDRGEPRQVPAVGPGLAQPDSLPRGARAG